MNYPVLIEAGCGEAAFGVIFPDLPGCFSAGDTLDQALEAAAEAAEAWIGTALEAGETVPPPSPLAEIRECVGYEGWAVGVVAVDLL